MNQREGYTLPFNTVKDYLSNVLNSKAVSNPKNVEHVLNLLLSQSQDIVTVMLNIAMMQDEYKPIKIGDYVKYIPSKYTSLYGDRDILQDKGLMTLDGFIFGTIVTDLTWRSKHEDFNCYSKTMVVDFNIWDEHDGLSIYQNTTITSSELTIIDKLPVFNCASRLDFFKHDNEKSDTNLIKTQ
tara:strand:- start:3743 stop:4291 length:549 start_codon:yes stop_codon:yes gene_type:complete